MLITITLLAFVVLLLVSLAALTRVETQISDNSQQLAHARQNALMGLNIAIGKLQAAAGPDQRVTARAVVDPFAATTNSKWTGVWDSAPSSATYGQRLTWLVSSPAAAPDASTSVVDPGATGVSATTVRLVGNASTDLGSNAATLANQVNVPLEEIRSDNVPGLATGAGGHVTGHYGYWVGDEGVKARANLNDAGRSPWFTPNAGKPTPDIIDRLYSVGLAQRNAVEWMRNTTDGTSLIEPLLPDSALATANKWISPEQLSLTGASSNTTNLRDAGRARYHDLTSWSNGVESDVRLGGLKRDLTAAFEMDDATFQASIFADDAPAADRTVMAPGVNTSRFVSSIYNETVPNTTPSAILRGPTWHLLRSHYRVYKSASPSSTPAVVTARALMPSSSGAQPASDRLPTPAIDLFNGSGVTGDPKSADTVDKYGTKITPRPTRSALLPYINRITFVISLQTVPTTAPAGAVGAIYEVRLVLTPIIVLHNPYNVRLELRDLDGDGYWGRLLARGLPFAQIIRANGREFTARTGSNLEDRVINLGAAAEAATNKAMSYNNMMRFLIPSMTMEPGEIRVFSPNLSNTAQVGLNMPLAANKFVESGYYLNQLNGQRFDCFGGPHDAELVRPATTRQPWPIGPGGADIAPPDDQDFRVLVTGDTPIEAAITTTKSGDGSMIIRFNVESENGDSTSNAGDNLSLFSELYVNKPGLGSGSGDVADRTYVDYNPAFHGGQTAANYNGDPVPIFAYDLILKTPDSSTAKAARPFMTSNPAAMVTERAAIGDYANLGNRRGFPLTAAPMQPTYRWWNHGSWTTDILDADPSGLAYWGPSSDAATGLSQVSLIEVPTRPLTSLAQFQHLMTSLYANEPYFAIGNSEASPFIPTAARYYDAVKGSQPWYFADISYLSNQALWDRTFFSSLTPGFDGTNYYAGTDPNNANSRQSVRDAWLAGTGHLPNTRIVPYRSPRRTDAERESGLLDPEKAAAHLLSAGAFNINSRSVEAWVAVLAGARNAAMLRTNGNVETTTDQVVIPHALPSVGNDRSGGSTDVWNGFSRLTNTQIRTLATKLVDQITQRQNANGNRPFLSLGEFINRALSNGALGQRGALQAAIDAAGINSSIPGTTVTTSSQTNFPVPENGLGNSAAPAAGFLKQADILQQIGPFLSARSDTFTIRAYGEAVNPIEPTETVSRAWCEAIVQRVPDFVGGENAETPLSSLPANSDSVRFGRQFRVVSFRWLSPDDI